MKKERILATIASTVIAISSVPVYNTVVYAEDTSQINLASSTIVIDNITYNITNGYAELVECDKSVRGKVVIPEIVEGVPVVQINTNSFKDCDGISNIIIPDSVTTIKSNAFTNCNMTFLTIGSGVIIIENGAFYNCKSLTEITIPDSVVTLGDIHSFNETTDHGVFEGCTGITKINIGNGVQTIGTNCFKGCSNVVDWTFSSTIKEIGSEAFECCSNLTTFNFPETVTYVGGCAFQNCSNLKYVKLNNSLTTLPDYLFDNTSITNLDIPYSVTKISKNVLTINSRNVNTIITIHNSDCSIPAESVFTNTYSDCTITIKGYKNSTAEIYANRFNYKFSELQGNKEDHLECNNEYVLNYTVHDTSVTLNSVEMLTNDVSSIKIPSYIENLPVKQINLQDISNVKILNFEDNMEPHNLSIKNCSFTEVNIHNTLKGINISSCSNIRALDLSVMDVTEGHPSIALIASIGLYDLPALETVIMPKDMTSTKGIRLDNCPNLSNISWPVNLTQFYMDSVININNNFAVTVPDSVVRFVMDPSIVYDYYAPESYYAYYEYGRVFPLTWYLPKNTDIRLHSPNIFPPNSTIYYYKNSPACLGIAEFSAMYDGMYTKEDKPKYIEQEVDTTLTKRIKELEETNKILQETLNSYGNRAYGDMNNDGFVDGRDASLLLTYYAKTSVGYTGTLDDFIQERDKVEN